ncbi:hypothetical protein RRG08_061669 [Elysia crispata]|uniref:Uncharacterized protein n=1 Tax=Elysia crispata TaxID=231223 RepID=A0AAE1DA75_9GAST|nr:hypothetical protein RRG08_061669 [Elysia crispata]
MYGAMVAEGSFSNRATVTGTAANFSPVKLLLLLSLRLETLTVFLKKKTRKAAIEVISLGCNTALWEQPTAEISIVYYLLLDPMAAVRLCYCCVSVLHVLVGANNLKVSFTLN